MVPGLFKMGMPWYLIKIPEENIILNFFKCVMVSAGNEEG